MNAYCSLFIVSLMFDLFVVFVLQIHMVVMDVLTTDMRVDELSEWKLSVILIMVFTQAMDFCWPTNIVLNGIAGKEVNTLL